MLVNPFTMHLVAGTLQFLSHFPVHKKQDALLSIAKRTMRPWCLVSLLEKISQERIY